MRPSFTLGLKEPFRYRRSSCRICHLPSASRCMRSCKDSEVKNILFVGVGSAKMGRRRARVRQRRAACPWASHLASKLATLGTLLTWLRERVVALEAQPIDLPGHARRARRGRRGARRRRQRLAQPPPNIHRPRGSPRADERGGGGPPRSAPPKRFQILFLNECM